MAAGGTGMAVEEDVAEDDVREETDVIADETVELAPGWLSFSSFTLASPSMPLIISSMIACTCDGSNLNDLKRIIIPIAPLVKVSKSTVVENNLRSTSLSVALVRSWGESLAMVRFCEGKTSVSQHFIHPDKGTLPKPDLG